MQMDLAEKAVVSNTSELKRLFGGLQDLLARSGLFAGLSCRRHRVPHQQISA